MASFETSPETDLGRALFEELLWVHSMIRRDLDIVRRLASESADIPPGKLKGEIRDLKTNGQLWRLKVGCLRYCRFVHSHHNLEDLAFFPVLRDANQALGPVVDKLESDHRKASVLLDDVEAAAEALTAVDDVGSRQGVRDTLTKLAEDLLAHLECEELEAGPTIRRLQKFDY